MPEIFEKVEYDKDFPKEKYAKVLSLDTNDQYFMYKLIFKEYILNKAQI